MKTKVEIEWDLPDGEYDWSTPDNIKTALSFYYKNHKFNVKDINELSGSEAIYGFCGWLTTRSWRTVMSENDDCAVIAELIGEFCEKNKLSNPRDNYQELLVRLDDEWKPWEVSKKPRMLDIEFE